MNFTEIALNRQSCRKYDSTRAVEEEKISRILESARLSPSACNGQPYHITVCRGETALKVAKATVDKGLNKFAPDAPIIIVISEEPYVASAALGARITHNDYRSLDIGILSAYITAEATAQGLGSCIIGWFDQEKINDALGCKKTVRLVITIGYSSEDDILRDKKRKSLDKLISYK